MDGLHDLSAHHEDTLSNTVAMRRTLAAAICCVGTGLHSGRRVNVTLRPGLARTGVVFRRMDLGLDIPARFDTVCDTRLSTVVGTESGRVGTVEHIMAALAACGVTDVMVELDGPEVPVLDGSASPWIFLIDCAGTIALDAPARVIRILRTVRVQSNDGFAELRPGRGTGLMMSLSIDFGATAIGRQALTLAIDSAAIRHSLAPARTFTLAQEVAGLQAAGLALGGSLDNAVVVDGARVLNPGGLRMADEFVRHKMLDAVGDLAQAGAALQGRFVGHRSGHALNNQVLHALFADSANWQDATPAHASGQWVGADVRRAA